MIRNITLSFATAIAAIIALALMPGCHSGSYSAEEWSKELYSPAYASGFAVAGAEGKESSIIRIRNPWQGADSVVTELFIARNGEKAPDGFPGTVLDGYASRIVAMSSTHVAMLDALDATGRIAGVSGRRFIANPYVRKNSGMIADVGYEGNIDFETVASVNPDIVLLYGVNGASSMEGKLRELGIPYVYIGDYLEESPLGKAEWMVAIAEIIGAREGGTAKFNEIATRYNTLRDSVAINVIEAPSVMLNVPYGDSWFMPPADSYMARLISDAGGDYIFKKETGNRSVPIDIEEAYILASQADIWLNLDATRSLDHLKAKCPKFSDIRCVHNGDVYNNTRRSNQDGGNDFFESAVVNPDLVLRDLTGIFHPELIRDEPVYYVKLK